MLSVPRRTIQRLANLLGYRITPTYFDYDPVVDNEFSEIFRKCKDFTMTGKARMYALHKAVEYIVNSGIPGDFVECGVWRGGSVMVIAYTLLEMDETNRKIYLYDTFAGMSKPVDKEDYLIYDKTVSYEFVWKKNKQKEGYNKFCFSPLPEVKSNVFSTGYPKDNFVFVSGKVEDTIPKTVPSKIALLRLDTDWYESTKHGLIHLFPILVRNGVLIIDDYGCFAGSKRATDEYFSVNKISILLNRIDPTGRIGVKL